MNNAFVWTSLAAAIVLVVIDLVAGRFRDLKKEWTPFIASLACFAAGFLCRNLTLLHELRDVVPIFLFGAGTVLLVLDSTDSDRPAALGLTLSSVGIVIGLWSTWLVAEPVQVFAFLAGMSAGTALLSMLSRGRISQNTTVVGFLSFGTCFLAKMLPESNASLVPALLLTAALLGLVCNQVLDLIMSKSKTNIPTETPSVLFVLFATLFLLKFSPETETTTIVGASVILALVSIVSVRHGGKLGHTMVLVAAMSWLGMATFAFGSLKAYGVAVAALAGCLTFLLSNEQRLLPVLTPLFALVGYRAVREAFPINTSGFEIGQHYALVGLLFGALSPMAAVEIARLTDSTRSWWRLLRTGLIGLSFLVVATGLVAFLGDKGSVGILIGLGLSPLLIFVSAKGGLTSTAGACGMMAWVASVVGVVTASEPPTRQDKLWIVGTMLGVVAVCAVIVAVLDRQTKVARA